MDGDMTIARVPSRLNLIYQIRRR